MYFLYVLVKRFEMQLLKALYKIKCIIIIIIIIIIKTMIHCFQGSLMYRKFKRTAFLLKYIGFTVTFEFNASFLNKSIIFFFFFFLSPNSEW